ncbi:hypothetical protein [Listeria booriae]|uniref:hypothetical protein n=1 Tax=Listeria booriae TaxID=1552123 RepID=UPI001629F0CD|nr:hypothetical protein [Listeria booriae]MBC2149341.1 hypothetical protein [Listeria booriae]
MPTSKTPIFTKGRILKIEMLEQMRDYPLDALDILTQQLSDGIITGLHISISESVLTVHKGIIKYNGTAYLIPSSTEITYGSSEEDTILKIIIHPPNITADYTETQFEFQLTSNFELETHEMELARFKLKPGAYLRDDYQDLADFVTVYNTVNVVHCAYAGLGGEASISPDVTAYFARELMVNETENLHDIAICYSLLNETRAIRREVLERYIATRLGRPYAKLSNTEIHQSLVSIISKVKQERRTGAASFTGSRRLIVD